MKAQIQSGESIAVIIIVAILIILGLFFLSVFRSDTGQVTLEREQQLSGMSRTIMIVNMQELACPQNRITRGEKCIDLLKINALENVIVDERQYFLSRFGDVNLTIRYIDLINNKWVNKTFYTQTPNNITSTATSFIPVTIYNASTDLKHFGILEVNVFS